MKSDWTTEEEIASKQTSDATAANTHQLCPPTESLTSRLSLTQPASPLLGVLLRWAASPASHYPPPRSHTPPSPGLTEDVCFSSLSVQSNFVSHGTQLPTWISLPWPSKPHFLFEIWQVLLLRSQPFSQAALLCSIFFKPIFHHPRLRCWL